MSVLACERCGAALAAVAPGTVVRCGYCGAENTVPLPPPPSPVVVQVGNLGIRVPDRPMTVEQIEEGFREKARAEADRLRTARIFAGVFAAVFIVVLGIVLLLAR